VRCMLVDRVAHFTHTLCTVFPSLPTRYVHHPAPAPSQSPAASPRRSPRKSPAQNLRSERGRERVQLESERERWVWDERKEGVHPL